MNNFKYIKKIFLQKFYTLCCTTQLKFNLLSAMLLFTVHKICLASYEHIPNEKPL